MKSFYAGPAHLIVGHDGSRRTHAFAYRWVIEITVRGYFINAGVPR